MKKSAICKLIILILTTILLTSCVNVYKKGVEYSDFPERNIPIYDDGIVFDYEAEDKEIEISYGTTDDIDDIIEFYSEEFDDEDYVILKEKEKKDEYSLQGYIDNTYFEIEIEEASREEEEYFEYIVNIFTEELDDEEIEKLEEEETKKLQDDEIKILENKTINSDDLAVLRFQLSPARDSAKLIDLEKPLEDLLSKKLNMKVEVTIATDYDTIIENLSSSQIDVAILSALQYVSAADAGYAEAILKSLRFDFDDEGYPMEDKPLVGGYYSQLLVHKDSGITDVEGLAGKRIAVSSFTSTSGFVWPANLLADNGIDPESGVEWINAGGHDNAILAIMNGEADAAFTFKDARTLYFIDEDYFAEIMDTCQFLMNTPIIPMDVICVDPSMNDELKESIKQAFIDISAVPEEIAIMNDVYTHKGYSETTDDEYDKVRIYLERRRGWNFD